MTGQKIVKKRRGDQVGVERRGDCPQPGTASRTGLVASQATGQLRLRWRS